MILMAGKRMRRLAYCAVLGALLCTPARDARATFFTDSYDTRASLDLGWSWEETDNRITTSFGTDERARRDATIHSYGADIRRTPHQGSGWIAGAWLRVFEDDGTLFAVDLHPTPGLDTRLSYGRDVFVLPYLGYSWELGEAANGPRLTLFAGPRIERYEMVLRSDESGGGGQVERFGRRNWDTDLTIGGDVDLDLGPLGENATGFLRIGGAFDFHPDMKDVTGRSSLNLDYRGTVEGVESASYRFFFGVGIKLK